MTGTRRPVLFLKAHVSGYTRKDGTPVRAHEDSRRAAAPEVGTLEGHALRALIEHADDHLEGDGAKAIDGFIGHGPRAAELGATIGYMSARLLEDAFSEAPSAKGLEARAQIEAAFKPVRAALRAHYGDHVKLYRVQAPIKPTGPNVTNMSSSASGARSVLSWTSHRTFAESYAGVRPDRKLYTDEEIAAKAAEFDAAGEVRINSAYRLKREKHKGFRIDNDEPFEVDSVDILDNNGDMITDTDGVREFMESLNEERQEHNDRNAKARALIVEADVPLDDVVWVSDRANQSEFIVRNRGDHAILAKAFAEAAFLRLRDPGEPTDAQKESGNYAKRKVAWRGLTISVENEAGHVRRGVEPNGTPWATRLMYAYGYVNRTMGVDGDQVDVYLGPLLEVADTVYIVHQRRYGHWAEYDEDKCMLGFPDEESARGAYLSCYDDPRFLGPITAMPVEEFVAKVLATKDAPAMIKAIVGPYVRDGHAVRGYDNHRRPAKPKPKQVDLFAGGADPELAKFEALSKRVVRIASGLSRTGDFMPAAHAGHGVGVEVGELSQRAIENLAQAIVDWKAPVFVDTGAFGRFMSAVKAGREPEPMDFDAEVFPVYDQLLDRISELNEAEESLPPPMLVMPDVVGDQAASLNLVAAHRAYVRAICDFPGVARAVIPIQRGDLSMADAYARLVEILGTDNFIVGVPSNAAAITPEEFTEFLATAKPRGVHILGALHDLRLRPRLHQILASGHDPEWVSADANPLRSQIIEHGQTKEQRQARIRERLGALARQQELDAWVEDHGGQAGLQAAYRASDASGRRRIMGLVMDLSGLSLDDARTHYGLAAGS